MRQLVAFIGMSLWIVVANVSAVETVVVRKAAKEPNAGETGANSSTHTIVGEVLVRARDGGVMLQSDEGRIWTLQPDRIVDRRSDDKPLVPINDQEMSRRLLAELPTGFHAHRTANYVIAHNTNEAYVRRVGALFEQLRRGFFIYWKNQKWKLDEPRFPLVAIVFANRADFLRHAQADIGDMAKSIIGYYHLESNRMVTFNVPNLERNIATIVHEATHQLAYNCGVQKRFADNPMWVSEGMATFFEAPDFNNPSGWRTIGRTNPVNLARWRKYLPNRPGESLVTLLSDDQRFRNSSSTESAYAESWALTYFLMKTRRDEYVDFLKQLSEGAPLVRLSPQERLDLVEKSFGMTIAELDQKLVDYMRRVR